MEFARRFGYTSPILAQCWYFCLLLLSMALLCTEGTVHVDRYDHSQTTVVTTDLTSHKIWNLSRFSYVRVFPWLLAMAVSGSYSEQLGLSNFFTTTISSNHVSPLLYLSEIHISSKLWNFTFSSICCAHCYRVHIKTRSYYNFNRSLRW